jgi:hypothetical protein
MCSKITLWKPSLWGAEHLTDYRDVRSRGSSYMPFRAKLVGVNTRGMSLADKTVSARGTTVKSTAVPFLRFRCALHLAIELQQFGLHALVAVVALAIC